LYLILKAIELKAWMQDDSMLKSHSQSRKKKQLTQQTKTRSGGKKLDSCLNSGRRQRCKRNGDDNGILKRKTSTGHTRAVWYKGQIFQGAFLCPSCYVLLPMRCIYSSFHGSDGFIQTGV
jgi:Neuraminidase (sialidase)